MNDVQGKSTGCNVYVYNHSYTKTLLTLYSCFVIVVRGHIQTGSKNAVINSSLTMYSFIRLKVVFLLWFVEYRLPTFNSKLT